MNVWEELVRGMSFAYWKDANTLSSGQVLLGHVKESGL